MTELVIEDGTIVPDANSYVTLAEARAYASARGVTLTIDDSVLISFLIKAKDYTENQRNLYQGVKVDANQSLQFPRYNVTVDGFEIAPDSIPKVLKDAQMQLAVEQCNDVDIFPTKTGLEIKREKVDVLETEYFENSGTIQPEMPAVDALLEPLFKTGLGSMTINTVRV